MKKITALCFLILVNTFVKAQESVVFKIKYLPNCSYKANINMDIESLGSVAANKAVPNNPASKLAMSIMTSAAHEMQTGVPMPDGSLPITIRYTDQDIKMSLNGKELPIPKKKMAERVSYGEINPEGKIHIDSITGKKANEQVTAAMTSMINKSQGQLKFPDKAMHIGDVFTHETPLSIPGNTAMDVNTISTYKLVDIKNNKAYFDIHIAMNGDVNIKDNLTLVNGKLKTQPREATISGSGNGKLIFDIEKSYTESKNAVLIMKIGSIVNKGKPTVTNMKITVDLKNQISPL